MFFKKTAFILLVVGEINWYKKKSLVSWRGEGNQGRPKGTGESSGREPGYSKKEHCELEPDPAVQVRQVMPPSEVSKCLRHKTKLLFT